MPSADRALVDPWTLAGGELSHCPPPCALQNPAAQGVDVSFL
jgi:hypothetical protein